MRIRSYKHIDELINDRDEIEADPDVQSIGIIGSSDLPDREYEQFCKLLKGIKKPTFGGLYPFIFNRENIFNRGFILFLLNNKLQATPLKSGNSQNIILHPHDQSLTSLNTLFCFYDFTGNDKTRSLNELFNTFGNRVSYFGGGCGSLNHSEPSVILNGRLLNNVFLSVGTEIKTDPCSVHGWENTNSKSFKATSAKGNKLITIDHRPAVDFYLNIIKEKTDTDQDFFDSAKSHPLGISRLGGEFIVRDIIDKEGSSLILADEIEEGEYFYLLEGDRKKMREATKDICHGKINADDLILSVDCYSRALYLNDEFTAELNALQPGNFYGASTLGEVINDGSSFPEFFNKTFGALKLKSKK